MCGSSIDGIPLDSLLDMTIMHIFKYANFVAIEVEKEV